MNHVSRRKLLAAAGSAVLPLAGCLASEESSDDEESDSTPEQQADTGGSESSSAETSPTGTATSAESTSTATETATPFEGGYQGIDPKEYTLNTLDVAGSPGDGVPLVPGDSLVAIDFFATWCGPCQEELPELKAFYEQYPDVHFVSISWEERTSTITDYWENNENGWPVAQHPDRDVALEYDVGQAVPTHLILDKNGEEIWRKVGMTTVDKLGEQIEAARE